MTILELLVVVLILLMVTAAAIPIMAPAMQNRQMREAARQLSTYLSTARNRAIETGRPAGVVIERFNGQPFSMVLSQVEVPPPYAGDFADSRMRVGTFRYDGIVADAKNNGAGLIRITAGMPIPFALRTGLSVTITNVTGTTEANGTWTITAVDNTHFDLQGSVFLNAYTGLGNFTIDCGTCVIATTLLDTQWKGLLRYGDSLQLDYRGPHYVLASQPAPLPPTGDPSAGMAVTTDPPYWFLVSPSGNAPVAPPPGYVLGVPYQFFRQPTRSSEKPLQLPEGIVVDLACSGMGSMTFMHATSFGGLTTDDPPPYSPPVVTFDPVILFSPSGRLEAVSQLPLGKLGRPTDAVYLLLGRRELMFDAASKTADADVVDQNLSPIPPTTAVLGDPTTWPPPPEHFWVSAGYQTGLVTVAEVHPNLQDYQAAGVPLVQVITAALSPARQFARESQSVGGR